MGRGTIAH